MPARVATRMALVRIGMDLGANDEVLANVKDVLAERTRIAAEEPANIGYLADLAETQTLLGRLIAPRPRSCRSVPTACRNLESGATRPRGRRKAGRSQTSTTAAGSRGPEASAQ